MKTLSCYTLFGEKRNQNQYFYENMHKTASKCDTLRPKRISFDMVGDLQFNSIQTPGYRPRTPGERGPDPR